MAYQKQIYQDGVTEYTEELFEHMDDGIFGAYPVQLIAINSTAPSTCLTGDKYYNTTSKKIFTATGTNTWGTNGETPLEDTAYWLISENGSYAWNGTDLVSIGGGKAEVVISDEEPEEGKLWVDTAEIPTIAGRDRLVNVSNEVDEDYRVNVLHSKNLINVKSPSNTINGLTYTVNSDKSITITGTSTAQSVFRFTSPSSEIENLTLEAGIYTIKATNKPSNCALQLWYSSSSQIKVLSAGVEEDTFNVSSNTTYENFRAQLVIPNGTTVDTTVYIMLYKGTDETTYEPYITPSIYVDNEEIYNRDNLDIKDITNEITFITGFQIDDGKLYKQGKHIFGTLNIKTPTLTASTQYSSFMNIHHTLKTTTITGGFATTGDRWGTNSGFCYLYISTSGACAVSSNINATYLRIVIDIMEE